MTSCEYGVGANFVSVTIPYDMNFGEGLAVFWSLVSFALPATFAIVYLGTRSVTALLLLWVGLAASLINEFFLYHIDEQQRPYESCLKREDKAFPSGHASQAGALFVWPIFEALITPYWKWPRKMFVILVNCIIIVPVGPLRTVLHDHTWAQIGAGTLWGVIWGIFNIVLVHLIGLFLWEFMQMWKPIRWILRNDWDPKFKFSIFRGKKYNAKTTPFSNPKAERFNWKKGKILISFYFFTSFIFLLLGLFGIAAGVVKDHRDPDCDRAAPGLVIGMGVFTLFQAVALFIIALLLVFRYFSKRLYNKIQNFLYHKYNPVRFTDLWWVVMFFFFMAVTWGIAGTKATETNCPSSGVDYGLLYIILWFVVEGLLFVVAVLIILSWVLNLIISIILEKKQAWKERTKEKELDTVSGVV